MRPKDPLAPSWIDGLTGWITRIPGPAWAAYLAGTLLIALLMNVIFWIDGSLPLGQVNLEITVFAIFVLYWLALYQFLTGAAVRALDTFQPLLDEEQLDLSRTHAHLTILPRAWGTTALLLGLVLSALMVLGEPPSYGTLVPQTALISWTDVVITGFLFATFLCVVLRSYRQLRMVRTLHEQVRDINILHLVPVHAFSSLTASTGVGIILLLVFAYIYETSAFDTAVSLISYGITALLAITVFIIPLIGIRGKLEVAKADLLKKNSMVIQTATEAIHRDVLAGEYGNMKEREAAIRALTVERELYAAIPTWPWKSSVLREFASALLLPIVLWLIIRLLERVL